MSYKPLNFLPVHSLPYEGDRVRRFQFREEKLDILATMWLSEKMFT